MRNVLAYAEFDGFWARLQPETPSGKDVHARMEVHTDAARLEAIYDATAKALDLLEGFGPDRVLLSRVVHHLKRIPRIPVDARPVYGEIELFAVKKFLHNLHALVDLLPEATCAAFRLERTAPGLAEALDRGRQCTESFYVADAYDPSLAEVRECLRLEAERLESVRHARAEAIRARHGLEFGTRAFLLVDRETLGQPDLAQELLAVEPHDEWQVLVRPRPCGQELVIRETREALLARERALEEAVLERLSGAVREALPWLLAAQEALTDFDLAFARARLAQEEGLVRPVLGEGAVEIHRGRFLPCEDLCGRLGLDYTPLDACFDQRATVIFGSNMGGKTIVLKTLLFLQLCAQTGLFVPAGSFRTRVFRHLHYIGEGRAKDPGQGLSGFGFEIVQFLAAWRTMAEGCLVLFDEFARTTHSLEAEALLSGVLEALTSHAGCVALVATHFRGVQRLPGVAYLRMKGLDHGTLDLRCAGEALPDRIRAINLHMDHRLEPDDGLPRESDALAVAALLGLDESIVRAATAHYRGLAAPRP